MNKALLLAGVMVMASLASGVEPKPRLPDTQPATGPLTRGAEIRSQVNALYGQFLSIFPKRTDLLDPAKRQADGAKALEVIRKSAPLFEELAKADPGEAQGLAQTRALLLPVMALLGDATSEAALKQKAQSSDPAESAEGNAGLLRLSWWRAAQDEKAQEKLLEEVVALAKAKPEDEGVLDLVMGMAWMGPATPAIKLKAQKIVVEHLKGESAKQVAEVMAGQIKQAESLGKPAVFEGTQLDGTKFSTAPWKGKVIIVDFWATWCGPCLAELPKLKEFYAKHHDKGLEVLAISNDRSADELKTFIENDKAIAWPQLFQAPKGDEWHPLATQWGVNAIPTMFLIDRKGVLRSVDAREDYEQMVPKLLEEKE
jgi:thiol-disulfide isomerase/thioredoxin